MPAKPYRLTETPAPVGMPDDGEVETLDARDRGLIDRDVSHQASVAAPRPPAVADKARPGAKPFRVS